MRINFTALLWLAVGLFPVIGGFESHPPSFSAAPPAMEGEKTNISANGGGLTVPDGDS